MKTIINLSIDPEIWALARVKYPRKVSSLVEEYLKGLLGVVIEDLNDAPAEEIEDEISIVSEELSKLQYKLKVLQAKKNEREKELQRADEKEEERNWQKIQALKAAGYD